MCIRVRDTGQDIYLSSDDLGTYRMSVSVSVAACASKHRPRPRNNERESNYDVQLGEGVLYMQ
jgi:hypothetical protein